MEIQQHDGVVVEVAGSRQGFAKSKRGGRGVTRDREAPGTQVRLPSLPSTIYRSLGGRRPLEIPSNGRGGGLGGGLAPKPGGGAPTPLGFPTLGAREAQGGRTSPPGAGSLPTSAHGALRDRWPHPVDPRDPSGGPGTIPDRKSVV